MIYNQFYNPPQPALNMTISNGVSPGKYSQFFGADMSGGRMIEVRVDYSTGSTSVYFTYPGGPTVTLASTQSYLGDLRSVVRAAQGGYWVSVSIGSTQLEVALPYLVNGVNGYVGFGACTTGSGKFTHIDIEFPESVPPNAIPSGNITATPSSNSVMLSWTAATDNAGGSGILHYRILKAGRLLASTNNLTYTDNTASPSTTSIYTVRVVDRFYNYTDTNKTVTTPSIPTNPPYPSVTPEGRQTGVRPTGTYWGAGSENIDVRSGNLNFTLPVFSARSRSGWSVPFGLSYNS